VVPPVSEPREDSAAQNLGTCSKRNSQASKRIPSLNSWELILRGFTMAIHSIKDIEAMTQDQIEIILHASTKALAADPTNVESRATFSLVNDHAVCNWLAGRR
jgi:hypothetical protein